MDSTGENPTKTYPLFLQQRGLMEKQPKELEAMQVRGVKLPRPWSCQISRSVLTSIIVWIDRANRWGGMRAADSGTWEHAIKLPLSEDGWECWRSSQRREWFQEASRSHRRQWLWAQPEWNWNHSKEQGILVIVSVMEKNCWAVWSCLGTEHHIPVNPFSDLCLSWVPKIQWLPTPYYFKLYF